LEQARVPWCLFGLTDYSRSRHHIREMTDELLSALPRYRATALILLMDFQGSSN
jgi:hypothetical protein